jgi:hypothetical protein
MTDPQPAAQERVLKYVYQQPALEREIATAPDLSALEAALFKVVNLNRDFRDPSIYGRRLFAKGLDALVPQVAKRLGLEDVPQPKSNDRVLILGSAFYDTGGHTRIAIDIESQFPDRSVTVVLTGLYNEYRYAKLLYPGPLHVMRQERSRIILSAERLLEKIVELYMVLAAIRPSRIFLLPHHMDIVAVTGCWPFRNVVDFVHHGDHVPALGATLPFAGHVDPTYRCHQACLEAGLSATYSGMAADTISPTPRQTGPDEPVRLATCGAINKYAGRNRYGWIDFAIGALKRPNTMMYHIGPTTPEFENEVRRRLEASDIAADRYVFVGRAPSLQAALSELSIDIYVASFPEGGGKATLEAMAANLPIVMPSSADMPPLVQFDLPLKRWSNVTRPEDMSEAIAAGLALRETLRSPESTAEVAREIARFNAWVAGSSEAAPS